MKAEYDFSSMKAPARGKYYKAYRAGHKVEVHRADGVTSVQLFKKNTQPSDFTSP